MQETVQKAAVLDGLELEQAEEAHAACGGNRKGQGSPAGWAGTLPLPLAGYSQRLTHQRNLVLISAPN